VNANPRDIEIAELRALLEQANERLALAESDRKAVEAAAFEAQRRQVDFLATVAHELRNPLMPLRLAALMLDRARTDEAAHARLQATITGQVAQIARLIGDLMEGSRICTGKFRLVRTLIDLTGVLDRAMETSRPAMGERRQEFTSAVPAEPIMVLGDAGRLIQVFGNLLENASKYTPAGGVISMRVAVRPGAAAVSIADNGIGISAGVLPHVFGMFVRDAHASAGSEGGLGIGLAVVRELVKAHEGSVAAHSDGVNRGSEFTVVLPLALAHRSSGP